MAYTAKTEADFQNALELFITAYNTAHGTNIDTRDGEVFKDIVIDAPASQYAVVSTDLETVSKTFSVNYAEEMTQADLIELADNYDLTLNQATYSAGSVYFVTYVEPSYDIIINAGTIVSTSATAAATSQLFETSETVVMYAVDPSIYQFTDSEGNTGWRISADVQAVVAGLAGNSAANTITNLNQSISGITSVYNELPTLGGTDVESNASFGARIKAKLAGNNVGTSDGIKSLMLANALVTDVSVVGPNDPEMARNPYGGAVDVYILGSNNIGHVENQIYSSTLGYIPLVSLPTHSVSMVTGTVGGIAHTFNLTTEAVFVKDTGVLAGSSLENSVLTFPTAVKPDNATAVNITLTYDSLIPDLQTTINDTSNSILASDILVREVIPVTVNVYCEVSILSGYVPATMAAAIKTVITNSVNSTTMGVTVVSSELIKLIDEMTGVRSVDLPSFVPASDVSIGKDQVSVIGTIQVKIGSTIY